MAVLRHLAGAFLVLGAPERTASVGATLGAAGMSTIALRDSEVARLVPVDLCAIDGWVVHTPEGDELAVRGVVAVNAPVQLPWLDPGLLDWERGHPALVGGLLAPGLANLYFVGPGTIGVRPETLRLLVSLIETQAQREHPLVDDVMCVVAPSHQIVVGRAARRTERRIERRIHSGGGSRWRAAAGDVDGPLAGVRGA